MKIGCIINLKSRQNHRGKTEYETLLAARPDTLIKPTTTLEHLHDALHELAQDPPEILVLSGGDGTIQAALTLIIEQNLFAKLPRFVLVPQGTTNMTATDAGIRRPVTRSLAHLLAAIDQNNIGPLLTKRRTIRVEGAINTPPQHGMFFGTGVIPRAINTCYPKLHSWGVKGNCAIGLTLIGLLLNTIFRRTNNNPDRVYQAQDMTIAANAADAAPHRLQTLLFIATGLHKLTLNSKPFWNQTGEGFAYTYIAFPPPQLLRSTLKVLYGWPSRTLPDGYYSATAETCTLAFDGPFTIDGEIFAARKDQPLHLSAGPELEFLRIK